MKEKRPDFRRRHLRLWLQQRGTALTAREVVENTELYFGHGRYDRALLDLKVLKADGLVERLPGRPAKWGV